MYKRITTTILAICLLLSAHTTWAALPEGLFYLDEKLPNILYSAQYATADNFTGAPVPGYNAPRIVVSERMANALQEAEKIARENDCRLFVYDATRPQRAVDRFAMWAQEDENNLTKNKYYPNINTRAELFSKGFIAQRSSHSKGVAIDLTLADKNGTPLDMGGHFDWFDEQSTNRANITSAQLENRWLLMSIMKKVGLISYSEEWWHFSFAPDDEHYLYYDFVIEPKT